MKKVEEIVEIDESSAIKRLIAPKDESVIEVVIDDWNNCGEEKVIKDVTRVMMVENKNANVTDIFIYDTRLNMFVSYIPKPINDTEVIMLSDKFNIFRIK